MSTKSSTLLLSWDGTQVLPPWIWAHLEDVVKTNRMQQKWWQSSHTFWSQVIKYKGHGVSALPAEMLAFGAGSLCGGRSAALRPPCWQEAQTLGQVLQEVLTAQVPGDSQHQPPGTHARCLQPTEVSCPCLRLSSDEALGVMTEATYVYYALPDF